MNTVIKSLNRYSILAFHGLVPEYVIKIGRRDGYYALGMIDREGGKETLIGMSVFYVSSTSGKVGYAEVVYVYMIEEYRRQGQGNKLLRGVDYILRKSGVKYILALLPSAEDNGFGYAMTENELNMFIIAGGFIPAEDPREIRPSVLREFFDAKDIANADRWIRHL